MRPHEVTLIVPTRNEAHNVERLLSSVPRGLQVVVVDASTDATPEIVRGLLAPGSVLLREQSNVSAARQRGATLASRDWLLFTDADVVFPDDYFLRLAAQAECDAVYGPKLSQDRYGWYYRLVAVGQRLCHRCGVPAASGSNLLVRRRAFEQLGGFDLTLSCNEDSEILWRVKRAGFNVAFDPRLVVYATDHRRLERGLWRKTYHSLLRCTLLYHDLLPQRWRAHDWGYWADRTAAAPGISNPVRR